VGHVVPEVSKIWNNHPNYQDHLVSGRNKSPWEVGQAYTLGGAYFVNPKVSFNLPSS
jgi:hypothetical protein